MKLESPAPWWLPGGQLQTLWPALMSHRHAPGQPPQYRRERWTTPDGDFVDADWLDVGVSGPGAVQPRGLVVLFHGLEGSSRSHYAQALADWARANGWSLVIPHFRGCSGEINHTPRAYHSGDHAEIGWMLEQIRARHPGPRVAVGVSLGGNALLRWAEEMGAQARQWVLAVAAVCAPLDLMVAGRALGRGANRWIYTPMFLRTLKPKALAKLSQFPGLFPLDKLQQVRDIYDFDNVFTAPLHGFRDTDDYWRRASAGPRLAEVQLPALVINPLNDPFVPVAALPERHRVGAWVTLLQPPHGGHVGFASGGWPGDVRGLPCAVMGWMREVLGSQWPAQSGPNNGGQHG